jgi:acyl-CoA dehydrogenase
VTFSGFDLPEDLTMLRDVVARFVAEQIVPAEDAAGPTARALPPEALTDLQARARQAGLWCLDAPAAYGGGGLGAFQAVVVWEAASKHRFCHPVPGGGAFGYNPPAPLYQGTEDQIERYVRPHIEHGWLAFNAIAEAGGGSDPARAIRTTAVPTTDGWALNGEKLWITHAGRARYGVVYARTEGGISCFIVDGESPGMTVTELPVVRDAWPYRIRFDDVRIPASNLVGEEGRGLSLAGVFLQRGRLVYAARSVGIAEEALRMAREWMADRDTFGAPLTSRQALQFAIADARTRIDAARLLTWRAAWTLDSGRDARSHVAAAKLTATEAAYDVVDLVMQVFGAIGTSRELPIEGWWRDLRVARIVEGSSEILRQQLANAELRALPGDAASN